MPEQKIDAENDLSQTCRQSLRHFFAEYEIQLISCFHWRVTPPWKVDYRRCLNSFWVLPVRGRVRIHLQSGSRVIGPGEYLMLPDGERHALSLPEGAEHLEQFTLHCHVHDRWHRSLFSRFREPFGKLAAPAIWHRSLRDVACFFRTDAALAQMRGQSSLREILALRLRNDPEFNLPKPHGDPRIERVLEMMTDHLSSPLLSIESLAQKVNLSTVQIRKLFQRELRTGPKLYLTRLRLEKATSLLRHTGKSIKEVSMDCGFVTPNYFHLVFRQAFDCTPSEYRQSQAI